MSSPGPTPDQELPVRLGIPPAVPTILALLSIWLWAFRPAVLTPDPPSIPVAYQEAGLRMEMFIRVNEIRRFVSENGHLPSQLSEVSDSPDGLLYFPLTEDTFELSGRSRDITVDYTSTQSVTELLANAKFVVTGGGLST